MQARTKAIVALAVVCVGAALLLAACGAPDVSGTYKSTGAGVLSTEATLTINSDGTFKASGPLPMQDSTFELTGTWTQDGDQVTLEAEGPFASLVSVKTGAYEDGTLTFGEEIWQKQ